MKLIELYNQTTDWTERHVILDEMNMCGGDSEVSKFLSEKLYTLRAIDNQKRVTNAIESALFGGRSNCPACGGLGHQNGCEVCHNSGIALVCNKHFAHGMGGDHFCTRAKGHQGPHRDS